MSMSGGCLCGAVRYEITGEPKWVGKCYCRDCQRESGTGHNDIVGVAAEDFRLIQSEPNSYASIGGSGAEVVRYFCGTCGAPLYGFPKLMGKNYMVRAGSLDDASNIKMTMAIFTSHAQPWDLPPQGLMCFPEAPPAPTKT